MGTDKSLVVVEGVAMARRVADALEAARCAPIWCQGGDAAALARLGLDVRPDRHPHAGVLAAIADALAWSVELWLPGAVVAACELPHLDVTTVERLLSGGHPPVSAIADEHGAHLVSWWTAASLEPLTAALDAGQRSYRQMLDDLGAMLVHLGSEAARRAVHNVNAVVDLDSDPG